MVGFCHGGNMPASYRHHPGHHGVHCSGDRAGVSRSLLGSAFSSPLHIHPWEAPRMIMNKMIKSYDKQREQYNEIIIGVWHCPLPLSR